MDLSDLLSFFSVISDKCSFRDSIFIQSGMSRLMASPIFNRHKEIVGLLEPGCSTILRVLSDAGVVYFLLREQ